MSISEQVVHVKLIPGQGEQDNLAVERVVNFGVPKIIDFTNFYQMSEVNIDLLVSHSDEILQATGQDSLVDWDVFSKSSNELLKSIEGVSRQIHNFREAQQQNFLETMRKLKGADVVDVVKTVKSKKLPNQALKIILNRFKVEDGKPVLAQPLEELKKEASTAFNEFVQNNNEIKEQLDKLQALLLERTPTLSFKVENKAEQPREPAKFTFPEERLNELSTKVQLQLIPGTDSLINMRTYAQIVEASISLTSDEYARITDEARLKQREVLEDPNEYLSKLNDFMVNFETLINEGQIALAEKVGIPAKKFQESEVTLMERGLANNLLTMQGIARTKLKESLRPKKSVTLDEAKSVIAYQTELIKEKSDHIKNVFAGLPRSPQTSQLIPLLLTLMLNDFVFKKYGYQEQDFMQCLSDQALMKNPDLMDLFKDMELAIIQLMQKLELIPEDLGNFMAQQSNLPSNQMPMAPPGLLPGADPMALLQFQQKQAQMNMKGKK